MTINKKDTLFICGYWPLSQNKKRSLEHYNYWGIETLKLISGSNLLFLSNNKITISKHKVICDSLNINFQSRFVELEDLPGWKFSKPIYELKEKPKFPANYLHIIERDKKYAHWKHMKQNSKKIYQ